MLSSHHQPHKKKKNNNKDALKQSRKIRCYSTIIQELDGVFHARSCNPSHVELVENPEQPVPVEDFHGHDTVGATLQTILKHTASSAAKSHMRLHYEHGQYEIEIKTDSAVSSKESCRFEIAKISSVSQGEASSSSSSSTASTVKESICEGTLHPETGKVTFIIDDQPVFEEGSPRPRGVQGQVLHKVSEALQQGQKNILLLMGTGSGKSFVIAGIPHALKDSGIYIVPNDTLAYELDNDALKRLHGKTASVFHAAQLSVDDFKKVIDGQATYHMILRADDPRFHEKAATIKDKMVFIDESHQHTFNEQGIATLETLKGNNTLFALTGTPTSRLFDIFGDPLVDINLHHVIKEGGVRMIKPEVVSCLNRQDAMKQTILHYLSDEVYVSKGAGYRGPEDYLNEIFLDNPLLAQTEESKKIATQRAISMAIEHNRQRISDEKNFLFCGDLAICKQLINYYQTLLQNDMKNHTAEREELTLHSGAIKQTREQEERYRLALLVDPVAQRLQKPGFTIRLVSDSPMSFEPNIVYISPDLEGGLRCDYLDEETQEKFLQIPADALSPHYDGILNALSQQVNLSYAESSILMHWLAKHGVECESIRKNQREAYQAQLVGHPKLVIDWRSSLYASQIAQINQAINAHALWFIYDDSKIAPRDLELVLRTKTLAEFLSKHVSDNASVYNDLALADVERQVRLSMQKTAALLPAQQFEFLVSMIAQRIQAFSQVISLYDNLDECIVRLNAVMEKQNAMFDEKALLAPELGIEYIALAPLTSDEDEQQKKLNKAAEVLLEQFRFGLVHQVVSSKRFTTGTSIPSVRSCQQLICDINDPLIDGIETMQLLARGIRAPDGVAGVAQFVAADRVPDNAFIHVTDIVHADSGNKIKATYEEIHRNNLKRSRSREYFDLQKLHLQASQENVRASAKVISSLSSEEVKKETQHVSAKAQVNFFEEKKISGGVMPIANPKPPEHQPAQLAGLGGFQGVGFLRGVFNVTSSCDEKEKKNQTPERESTHFFKKST